LWIILSLNNIPNDTVMLLSLDVRTVSGNPYLNIRDSRGDTAVNLPDNVNNYINLSYL
jgi:hypothetical protein